MWKHLPQSLILRANGTKLSSRNTIATLSNGIPIATTGQTELPGGTQADIHANERCVLSAPRWCASVQRD